MLMIHAYIINIGTYRKLKRFWTKNSHPFVNGSSIINYPFISGKIKQKQFFLQETKLKQNWIFVFKIIPSNNIIVLNILVVSLTIGCLLDNNLCGESMARRALKKINGKLKFLYRQAIFLNPACKRLLCNALIQPLFGYGCTSWYPLLSKAFKKGFKLLKTNVYGTV